MKFSQISLQEPPNICQDPCQQYMYYTNQIIHKIMHIRIIYDDKIMGTCLYIMQLCNSLTMLHVKQYEYIGMTVII